MKDVSPLRLPALALAVVMLSGAAVQAADAPPAPAPVGRFVFQEICTLAPTEPMGDTPYGHRQRVPITGGTFAGPNLRGVIEPGGADTQLKRADGSLVIDADYVIQTDDGARIRVRNIGALPPLRPGQPFSALAAPVFEAPIGRYDWLNTGLFVSRITPAGDPAHPAVKITIYKLADTAQ